MTNPTITVIIAGNHREAHQWCHDHDVNPRDTIIITHDKDTYRLQGHRLSAEQVIRVGTWYENRGLTPLTGDIIRSRILLEDT